ncbi:MAG: cobyric acid synthase [Desulfovibrionaceae bacterium]|nr:cobyric acid synthase [Desulfovibrionaceae bacterium]MBF0512460.1 cobyric acid synthase [Desulfovibrionaceae bacterium]
MQSFEHGGNIRVLADLSQRDPQDVLDFSANINPLGAPPWLRQVISSAVSSLRHYPDPEAHGLRIAAAGYLDLDPGEILAGNGASDLLYALVRACGLSRAVIPAPSFGDYARACEAAGLETIPVATGPDSAFTPDLKDIAARLSSEAAPALVILGRPNNPAGMIADAGAIRELAIRHPESHFCVDEAFGWFVEGFTSMCRDRPSNVSVLHSLTKILAIPGLRLGLMVASGVILDAMRAILPPWSVNTLAQAVGERAFADKDFFTRSAELTSCLRTRLLADLSEFSELILYPGPANFILCRLDRPGLDAKGLFAALLKEGVAIRVCDNFTGLDARYFRVAVRPSEENAVFLGALRRVLKTRPGRQASRVKSLPPAVMFLGTSSNAGKSLLAAAMGRIMLEDGFHPAPFKAQNMALNSGVTADGKEMGRAQILQAQACGLAPDVRMNPVLLKPSSDTGSQVIVLGEPVGNMNAAAYAAYKATLWPVVCRTYVELAAEHDVMILEGAGSPAEINLKAHDIVNTAMAREAHAKALVVGDIDRGGVFAGLAGTMELLEEWERRLVAGLILNKFRGDPGLLGDGPECIARLTGAPVLGVVPFIKDLELPEEDSVNFKQSGFGRGSGAGHDAAVDVAVVDLAHISNFTDFDALRMEPDVSLRTVRSPSELGRPDAVIVPGSKNVPADLRGLRENGLAEAIVRLASQGAEVVGVCAGLQILGQTVRDPSGVESAHREDTSGLGLLPVDTELMPGKTLARVRARHEVSGLALSGYEIHHGVTRLCGKGAQAAVVREDGEAIGYRLRSGLVWGSYLHGIFDADAFRRWWIDRARERKGLAPLAGGGARFDIEPALNRLAAVARDHLDIPSIYRILGLSR